MNYYKARELKGPDGKPAGKWHYTVMNDGRTRPIGYCAEPANGCNHTDAKQACNCYASYIIEQRNGMLPGGFPLGQYDANDPTTELVITSSY